MSNAAAAAFIITTIMMMMFSALGCRLVRGVPSAHLLRPGGSAHLLPAHLALHLRARREQERHHQGARRLLLHLRSVATRVSTRYKRVRLRNVRM